MQFIGKLDKEKFRKITSDITTEDVILTTNQIQHIIERHPHDYENYYCYMKEIIESPDYIMKDKHPNTAILIKSFNENGKNFQIILRLHTSRDKKEYKNSIITFWKIGMSKYNQYIRNKEIIYKRLDI